MTRQSAGEAKILKELGTGPKSNKELRSATGLKNRSWLSSLLKRLQKSGLISRSVEDRRYELTHSALVSLALKFASAPNVHGHTAWGDDFEDKQSQMSFALIHQDLAGREEFFKDLFDSEEFLNHAEALSGFVWKRWYAFVSETFGIEKGKLVERYLDAGFELMKFAGPEVGRDSMNVEGSFVEGSFENPMHDWNIVLDKYHRNIWSHGEAAAPSESVLIRLAKGLNDAERSRFQELRETLADPSVMAAFKDWHDKAYLAPEMVWILPSNTLVQSAFEAW